jgi:glycolate oxidase iron-sulfur subunit
MPFRRAHSAAVISIAPGYRIADAPTEAEIGACVHCGLCLPSCPTFRELHVETESPRGRLHLMKALYDGRIEATDRFVEHMDLCLGCRACESNCPSGVHFGHLMEATRAEIQVRRPSPWRVRAIRRFVFGWLFNEPARLATLAGAIRLYQRSGLQSLVRATGLLTRISPRLADAECLLPRVSDRPHEPIGTIAAHGPVKRIVAMFAGCIMRVAFADTNRATLRVLSRHGCEVEQPEAQVCCGALHAHAGERERAKALARRNIVAFERSGATRIVVNAAGCGAMLKEYGQLLANDPAWAERARAFGDRVRDVSEILAELPLDEPASTAPIRVTYQDACHLAHAQRIRSQPRAVLGAVGGVQLVEMADADRCCGSAGIYNVTQPELAARFGEQKADNISATAADVVVSANPGCLIQIQAHLAKCGSRVRAMHLVDFLDQAYARVDQA